MFVLKVENSLLLNQFKSLQLKLDVLLNHHPLKDFVVISGPNLKKQYPILIIFNLSLPRHDIQ